MSSTISPLPGGEIEYPDSDGLPMSDNTKQYRWLSTFHGNLAVLFGDRDNVFVAGNLLWYPEEGHPEIRIGPDVLVAFGRPKGDRGSYKQWEEGGVPPTVVFEVLSPGNTVTEMDEKWGFYEEHGVEEYYIYDPDANHLMGFVRTGEVFRRVRGINGFVSQRLGIRFDLSGPELAVFLPDGQPFRTFEQSAAARVLAEEEAKRSRQDADRSREEADRSRQQLERMGELARKALRGQATAEELRELEQLGNQSSLPPA
jgi:Uma2 family endonuclease